MTRDLGLVFALVFVFGSGLAVGVTGGIVYGSAVGPDALLAQLDDEPDAEPGLQPSVTCHVWQNDTTDSVEHLCLETGEVNVSITTHGQQTLDGLPTEGRP